MEDTEFLRRLVEIPSPTGAASEAVAFAVRWAKEAGFRAEADAAGNLLAATGPDPPDLMLVGHIDTVPGSITVREESGYLHGRGSVDAKGPLAAFLLAARSLLGSGARVLVVGTPDEEGPSLGAAALIPRFRPRAVIIGEPSGWDAVTIGYKGALRVNLRSSTDACHPSKSDEPTAVEHLLDLVQEIRSDVARRAGAAEGIFQKPSAAVREFRTEDDGITVKARARLDLRLPPGDDGAAVRAILAGYHGRVESTVVSHDPPVVMDKNTPLVRSFLKAIRAEGGTPRFTKKTGTSDMNVLHPAWRVPMVAYGPGDPGLDHTPRERISLEEFRKGVRILERVLRSLSASGP